MVVPGASFAAIACMSATSSFTRRDGRRPDLHHQRLRAFGSIAIVSAIRQCACDGITEQLRPIGAQLHDRRNRRLGVVAVAIVPAALELLPDLLAQVAAGRERQERIDAGPRVDDDPFSCQLPLVGRGLRRRHERCREPREIGLAIEHGPGVLVGQHLCAEIREQRGQRLIDLRKARLLRVVQPRPSPHEVVVGARRRRCCSGVRFAVRQRLVDGLNPLEQARVERDGVRGRRQLRLPLAIQLLNLRRAHVVAS